MNGTIPSSVGNLKQLEQFSLYLNKFSGTLPETMGDMTNLVGMEIYNNLFTGTIPPSFGNLANLAGMRIYNNHFHGPLPSTFNGCLSMKYIELYNNSLTGKIPSNFGEIYYMQELLLHDNFLTGQIPTTLSSLRELTVIMLHNNQLTGPMDQLFNASVQVILTTIQVSNNQLTGTLPAEAFNLPALLTFDAVSNCFHGTLPDNICAPQLLNTLALDGLSSATSCQAALLPSLSQSYVVKDPVKGTIPSCLFALPMLQTLHLSGNGFTGTLPNNLVIGANLTDLSLSHNQLTGSIPSRVQTRVWYNLDLSFNYLSGSLLSSFAPQRQRVFSNHTLSGTSLSLENNRLSGAIPRAVTDSPDLSVLKGNLFSCSTDRTDLPSADSNESNYQCGSEALDVVYYTWLGLIVLSVAVLVTLFLGGTGVLTVPQSWTEVSATLQKWFDSTNCNYAGVSTVHLQHTLRLYADIVKACGACGALILIVFLPLYGLLKLKFGTHEHQYAWTVSAAYQTGTLAAALELVALFFLLAAMLALMRWLRGSAGANGVPVGPTTLAASRMDDLRSRGVLLVYILVNGVVVVGVNIAFVYIALRESSAALFVSQIAIALFKMFWNHLSASGKMIRWLAHRLDRSATADGLVYRTESATLLMLAVALFNTLAIPCLVVLVISHDCFYNVFVAAPAVDSSYIILKCSNAENGVCISYEPYPQTTSYHPPFTYSYQCSSSFITYYAPAFVYMYIMTTFGSPLWTLLVQYALAAAPPGSYCFFLADALLPLMLKPLPTAGKIKQTPDSVVVNPIAGTWDASLPPDTSDDKHCAVAMQTQAAEKGHAAVSVVPDEYFNAHRTLLSFITYMGLLLTFGVAYPPLAPCIVVSVMSMLTCVRLYIERFLTAAREQKQPVFVLAMDEACRNVGSASMVESAVWMLVIFACGFYTLFLFDALGDEVGFQHAFWVLILVPLFPLILYMCLKVCILGTTLFAKGVKQGSSVAVGLNVTAAIDNIEL